MTERLSVVGEDLDEPASGEPVASAPYVPILDWVERSAMLAVARMGDNRYLVPLASVGLNVEVRARRLLEGYLTWLWHAYQLPTRRELLTVAEQLSVLRHRVATLERQVNDRGDRGGA